MATDRRVGTRKPTGEMTACLAAERQNLSHTYNWGAA